MRNVWNIAIWKTKYLLKEKSTLVNLFVLPIIFALIFGGMQSDQPSNSTDYSSKVGVIPAFTSVDSKLLIEIISHQLKTEMISFENVELANQALENGTINALVLWPKNFENTWAKLEPTPWTLVYERKTAQNFMMEQQLKQFIIGLNAIPMMEIDRTLDPKEQVELWLTTWKKYSESMIDVNVQFGHIDKKENSGFSRIFVGFSLMFLMFALNHSAGTILEEKEMGTWNRVLMAPLSKTQLILGNILHFLLLGFIQFIVLMVFSTLVFQVNWGNYLDTLIFAMIIILTVSGMGFMLATIVKTKAQQNIAGSIIITLTSMLGGVYWPLDFVSELMRTIANFVPQKWAMEGLLQLMSGGYRLIDVINQIVYLLLFLILFYIIGFIRIRKI